MLVRHKIDRIFQAMQEVENCYKQLAKQAGWNYNEFGVFYLLYSQKECTQAQISEWWEMPKQTVNNIVKDYVAKGIIAFKDNPADKRAKLLLLTEQGLSAITPKLERVLAIEEQAFSTLNDESKHWLEQGAKDYAKALRESAVNFWKI